jgi:hypothetical protein
LNIKPCMGHISGTWELLLCEYWRKSIIIGEKNMDLKRLTGRLKLRFLTEIGQFTYILLKPSVQYPVNILVRFFGLLAPINFNYWPFQTKYGLEKTDRATKTSLFDRNWAISVKPRRRSRPLRLVWWALLLVLPYSFGNLFKL